MKCPLAPYCVACFGLFTSGKLLFSLKYRRMNSIRGTRCPRELNLPHGNISPPQDVLAFLVYVLRYFCLRVVLEVHTLKAPMSRMTFIITNKISP